MKKAGRRPVCSGTEKVSRPDGAKKNAPRLGRRGVEDIGRDGPAQLPPVVKNHAYARHKAAVRGAAVGQAGVIGGQTTHRSRRPSTGRTDGRSLVFVARQVKRVVVEVQGGAGIQKRLKRTVRDLNVVQVQAFERRHGGNGVEVGRRKRLPHQVQVCET